MDCAGEPASLSGSGATPLTQLIPTRLLDKGTDAATQASQSLETTAKTADLANKANEMLKDTQDSFDALRRPPVPKQPQPPSPGETPEQSREMNRESREMNRAVQQSIKRNAMTRLTTDPFDDDHFKEECGVFGVFGHAEAAALTALGLHALQHRGQEARGSVAY